MGGKQRIYKNRIITQTLKKVFGEELIADVRGRQARLGAPGHAYAKPLARPCRRSRPHAWGPRDPEGADDTNKVAILVVNSDRGMARRLQSERHPRDGTTRRGPQGRRAVSPCCTSSAARRSFLPLQPGARRPGLGRALPTPEGTRGDRDRGPDAHISTPCGGRRQRGYVIYTHFISMIKQEVQCNA
jgi:hypothetical protein